MTPQEVIKTFMATLANHGYSYSSSVGKQMLDAAVKASSRFLNAQNVIDNMKADQVKAEREAVEEVLGSEYAGLTVSEVSSSVMTGTVKANVQNRKANIFLEKYCGIVLDNADTGAITGSDANITLSAGDVVYGTTLTAADLATFAAQDGMSLSGGKLIIGTGTEKTSIDVVPEIGNKYTATATTSAAQKISTGSNDWIVVATSGNDTILTGGADSIDAGAGADRITVGADYASIVTGAGNDSVTISADVSNVTLEDLTGGDVLTISGTFSVGSAQIEDTILVITDKTGTRQIRLGNYEDAINAKVNSTTIARWLSNAGFSISNLQSGASTNTIAESDEALEGAAEDGGRIDVDKEYQPENNSAALIAETQRLSASSVKDNIDLDEVTIASGSVLAGSTTVGTISNEFPNVSSFTKKGLTINLLGVSTDTSGNPNKVQSKTLDQLTDDQKTIIAGLFKWWAEECLTLTEDSYGISFDSDRATVDEIGLFFYDSNGKGNTLATVWNWWNSNGVSTKLNLNVNMHYYSGIDTDNLDGESTITSALLDRTLSHEFTHAVMGANITGYYSLPQFIKEGMAELTHGIDDERYGTIYSLAYNESTLNSALNLSNTGTGTVNAYAAGYMFLRYLAKQGALQLLVDYANPDSGESWTINKTTATYTVDGEVVATITGLKSGLVTTGNLIDGITVNNGVITLDSNVLGTTKVTLTNATGQSYTLALDEDISEVVTTDKTWTVSNGTATLKGNSTAGYALSGDAKTVTYTAAKNNQTLAIVSGLVKTGITADDFSTTSNVITLKSSMLGTSNVTLKGDAYSLALANEAPTPTVQSPYWTLSGTTATYKYDTSAGFTLSSNAKSATYSKATTTTLATVSGLAKGLTTTGDTINGMSVDGTVITLGAGVLGTSNVSVKGNYTLALADSAPKPTAQNPAWSISGTTATYKAETSAGFTLAANAKSATYSKAAATTLATVSGLAKNLTDADTDGISINDSVITLGANVLGTTNVSVKGNYTLALADNAPKPTAQSPYWAISGTTATYKADTTAGFTLATNAKSATYSKAATTTLATVSGLAKNLTDADTGGISINDSVITLGANVLGTTNVSVKGNYTLALADNAPKPTAQSPYWTISGTTATYKAETSAGFTLATNGKSANYSKAATSTLATVSGLAKNLTDADTGGISINDSVITLGANVLGTTNVSVKGNYTLALADNAPKPTAQSPYWTISGTTATYKYDTSAGFTLSANGKSANYAKAATNTLATISGLKSGLAVEDNAIDGITIDGKVITLSENVLGTSKITVKGDYTLALAEGLTTSQSENRWLVNGTTATFDNVQSDYFTASTDKKTLTYNKEKVIKNIITIKGLAKGAAVGTDGTVAGITLSDNTVTLSGDEYFGTKVDVTLADGYTLDNQLTAPAVTDTYWTVKNGTATLKQDMSDGYTLTTNAKTGVQTLTYSAAKTGNSAVTLATISGLNKNLTAVDGAISGISVNDGVITLDSTVLGTSNVSVKGDYTLALANSAPKPTAQAPYWGVSGTTATYKYDTSAGFTLATNAKSANYTKQTTTTLATITGLKKGLTVEDNAVSGITINDDVITLDADVLSTTSVSVKGDYTLALADSAPKPTAQAPYWKVSGTTAAYKYDTTAGFKLAANEKSATYTKATTTALATISGLAKGLKVEDNVISGITISDNVVTLDAGVLGTSSVSVKGDGYTLALTDVATPTAQAPYWKVSGTTVSYSYDTTAGFKLAANEKSAAYTKATTTALVTISGLKSGLTVEDNAVSGITMEDNIITLDENVLGTTKVSVKGDYTLAIDNDLLTPKDKSRWQVSGTTATFDNVQSGYFTPTADNKTLNYTKEKVLNSIIKVTGLAKGATVASDGTVAGITLDDKTLTLSGDENFGSKVEVTLANGYTLDNQLAAPVATNTYWTVKNGTATLKQDMSDGYTLTTNAKTGVQTLTYSAAKTGSKAVTLATVTGLNAGLMDSDGIVTGLSYDLDNKTVILDKRVLGTSNITVKGGFTLAPVTSGTYAVPTATKTDTIWGVSGTKATYKTVDIGYFTANGNTALTYNKEKVYTTYATISGVKSDTSADNFSINGTVITLAADALPDSPTSATKIALGKNDAYTLRLGTGIATVSYNSPSWSYADGKATYSAAVRSAGYSMSTDSKTITYVPDIEKKKAVTTTFATLSGVKSADGIYVGNKVITISEAALNQKKVTLSGNSGYTLALNSNVSTPGLTKTAWTNENTAATLIATVSAGYTATNDTTITYSKSVVSTLATVKGLANSTTTLDAVGISDKTITLSGTKLGSKVEVSGDYTFTFAADYNYASIVGSASNDTIVCEGSGLSVRGGTGDDYIDFGTGGGGNVFVYASGDGDDVIADFTPSKDKVKTTSGKAISVGRSGSDVVITVDKGTITLQGVAGQTISVINRSGVEQQFPTGSAADLLDSDNFISLDSGLDTLTDGSAKLGDLNDTQALTSTDLTTLTKQSSLLTYGKK